MTEHEQTNQTEQPAAQDSAAGKSLQPGGITPQVEAALAGLPPEVANTVREEFSQMNSRVEEVQRNAAADRQAMQQDTQMAGVLRECLQDSDFAEYLDHRSKGTLETYFLQKAQSLGQVQVPAAEGSSQQASEVPSETGSVTSDGVASGLEQRIASIERESRQAAVDREISQFTSQYPDYENYLPLMQSVRQRNPSASLADLYFTAKGMREQGLASVDAGAEAQQESPGDSGEPAQNSPPLPVGNPPGMSTPAQPRAKTMGEAMAQAKQSLGLPEGEFRLTYEG